MKARRTVGLSVFWYLACVSHVRPSSSVIGPCVPASCVCLFEDANVGFPILPVDTEDGSQYVMLELFEYFRIL